MKKYLIVAVLIITLLMPNIASADSVSEFAEWLQSLADRVTALEETSSGNISVNFNQDYGYYVSTDGDDENPGTQADPFRTIQKAIDEIPRFVNNASIIISSGTYEEDIDLCGIEANGYLNLIGENAEVGSILIRNCKAINVKVQGIEILQDRTDSPYNYPYGLIILNSSAVYVYQVSFGEDCTHALDAEWSIVYVQGCDIGNENVRYGLVSNKGSRLISRSNTGIASEFGLRAGAGGDIMKYDSSQPSGAVANEYSNTGGHIR